MTTVIVLNLLFALVAVGALVVFTRRGAHIAGGRLDEPVPPQASEPQYELERAA